MSRVIYRETIPISPSTPSLQTPFVPTRSGLIVLDEYPGEMFYMFVPTTQGDIVVEGKDGNVNYFPLVPAGSVRFFQGVRILSAATFDGTPVTTSATGIVWFGGAS